MRPAGSKQELLERALALEGLSLGVLAAGFGEAPPPDLRRNKGWIGQLVERELGVEATLEAGPDFPELGVELKTIPVDDRGRPRESTWVCVADMDVHAASWETSLACAKLSSVLWVPVVGSGAPGERVVGRARLWSPSAEEEAVLRADWEQHVETLAMGELWRVSAHEGVALQLRPKAARGGDTHWTVGEDGEWVRTQPKGFYLRRTFTASVLATPPGGTDDG